MFQSNEMGSTIHGRKLKHPDVKLKKKFAKTRNGSLVNMDGSRDFDKDGASMMLGSTNQE